MLQPFGNGFRAPGVGLRFDLVLRLNRIRKGEKPFGCIRPAIQQYIFNKREKILRDFLINRELSCVCLLYTSDAADE